MNKNKNYNAYRESYLQTPSYNLFWDEFDSQANLFLNCRANNIGGSTNSPIFLYAGRSLNLPEAPADYDRYTFGTGSNRQDWIAYGGKWIGCSATFAFPTPKTKNQVWLNGIENDYYSLNGQNYTGANQIDSSGNFVLYFNSTIVWIYGNPSLSGPKYAGEPGGKWYPIISGATQFNPLGMTYSTLLPIYELTDCLKYKKLADKSTVVYSGGVELVNKQVVSITDFDSVELLGTITSDAFNVADQCVDLPVEIADKLAYDEQFILVPKFFYQTNNEGKPISVPVTATNSLNPSTVMIPNTALEITTFLGNGGQFERKFYGSIDTRFYTAADPKYHLSLDVFKRLTHTKAGKKKKIEAIDFDGFRKVTHSNGTFNTTYGEYTYNQSLFDNPVETSPSWLVNGGSNMVFNVYKKKQATYWETGEEVQIAPARVPQEKIWRQPFGGNKNYNYFSWLDSRYVDLTANEITVQSQGYFKDFPTGTAVLVTGASNVYHGAFYFVVGFIFKTNLPLTSIGNQQYSFESNFPEQATFALCNQTDITLNGIYWQFQKGQCRKIDFASYINYRSTSIPFGSNASSPSIPSGATFDTNLDAWRQDLYLCVIKDFSEGHNGELTIYKKQQPWQLAGNFLGAQLEISPLQRKRLESFYGKYYEDFYYDGPAQFYRGNLFDSEYGNAVWQAGSNYFASTFTELPEGLEEGGKYYLIRNGNKIKFAATYEDAINDLPIELKTVGKGAVCIYQDKPDDNLQLTQITMVDGQEVETLLDIARPYYLINKPSGGFQIADTKAKALSGNAIQIRIQPNTYLQLLRTTETTQAGKYIWNPKESGFEPFNQKTQQVQYLLSANASIDTTDPVAADTIIQSYNLSVPLNELTSGPAFTTNNSYFPCNIMTIAAISQFPYGNQISVFPPTSFYVYDYYGGPYSPSKFSSIYPATIPDRPLASMTFDGITVNEKIKQAAYWETITSDQIINGRPASQQRVYHPATYEWNKSEMEAAKRNMISKAAQALSGQTFVLDINTTLSQMRSISINSLTSGSNESGRKLGLFPKLKLKMGNATYQPYQIYYGGIELYRRFLTSVKYGTTTYTYNFLPIGEPYYTDTQGVKYYHEYSPVYSKQKTDWQIDYGTSNYILTVMAAYATNKVTGEEYLSLWFNGTGEQETYSPVDLNDANGMRLFSNYTQQERLYKKINGAFVAQDTGENFILPPTITLGTANNLLDTTKQIKISFSNPVTQTWRKASMIADQISINSSVASDYSGNFLSQITAKEFQTTTSSFSGPVICNYSSLKKIWQSQKLTSNGIDFKLEIVPKVNIPGMSTVDVAYNSYFTVYDFLKLTLRLYSTPNTYKEISCTVLPELNTTTNSPVSWAEWTQSVRKTKKHSITLETKYTAPAGEFGPLITIPTLSHSRFSAVPNNGYELPITEDNAQSAALVYDDTFFVEWGNITELPTINLLGSNTEVWSLNGQTKYANNSLLNFNGDGRIAFKGIPQYALISNYGIGGELQINFEFHKDFKPYNYVDKRDVYFYSQNASKILKSGRHYWSYFPYYYGGLGTFNTASRDYIRLRGTVYDYYGNECEREIRIGFTTQLFSDTVGYGTTYWPTSPNPSPADYEAIRQKFKENQYSLKTFPASSIFPYKKLGVDGLTYMEPCPAPIAISHMTKIEIV